MGLKEILKSLGYSDEQITKIVETMKENNIHVSSDGQPDEAVKKLQEEIEQLKKDNEALQQKKDSTASEEVAKLQQVISENRRDAAVILALTKAHAEDVDYLMYKALKSGELEKIKTDESGKITGVDELVANLKKNYAGQFETQSATVQQPVRVNIKKLDDQTMTDAEPKTLEEAIAQKLSGETE